MPQNYSMHVHNKTIEGVLAIVRPRSNLTKGDYRAKLYDILLLDSKPPPADKVKAAKYLPVFSMKVGEDEPKDIVLSQLNKLTGLNGERAIVIHPRSENARPETRENQSRFTFFCVPISQSEKLNKRFVEQSVNSPGFYTLEAVIEMLNSGVVSFPAPTSGLVQRLENWLQEKHSRPKAVEALFRSRVELRKRCPVNNPMFLPFQFPPDDGDGQNVQDLPAEIHLRANEACARMLAIEKCDHVVINPLFGSGLQCKTKVNRSIWNQYWPIQPDYSKIELPEPEVPHWREKYPVHSCAQDGDVEGVKELLRQGQNHSKKDSISWAPIHYASWFGYANVVHTLLKAGCSPNISDQEDCTPLHLAARKGHPMVAAALLDHPDVDVEAKTKEGKTALEVCQTVPVTTLKHTDVAKYIIDASIRPIDMVEVTTMDAKKRVLKLTSGLDTSVEQLNKQLLREFNMPEDPYSQIFTIWICSKSLELQLKPDHAPMEQLRMWQIRTVEMLSSANPANEIPVLKWRRNAKISVNMEAQLTNQKAIDLLFHEAYFNYVNALYPCRDPDAITLAAILFLLWHGNLENGNFDKKSARAFLSDVKRLKELMPQPRMAQKKASHMAEKILLECRMIQTRDRTPPSLKKQFLNHCQRLTVYGSVFFMGDLLPQQGSRGNPIKCHIGVNDVGIHFITADTKEMQDSYKYSEIDSQTEIQERFSLMLNTTVHDKKSGRNVSRTVTIHSRQARLINYLMEKLREIQNS